MCADSIKTRVKLGARRCKARDFRAKIKINHARLRVAQNVRGFNTKKKNDGARMRASQSFKQN